MCVCISIFMIIFDFRKIRLVSGPTECAYSLSLFNRKLLWTITRISQTVFLNSVKKATFPRPYYEDTDDDYHKEKLKYSSRHS